MLDDRGITGRVSGRLATRERPFAEPTYYGQYTTVLAATPSVFRTFGVRILNGRSFGERDVAGSTPVIVLSQLAARSLFGTTDALGRQVLQRKPGTTEGATEVETLTVVGVAADTDTGAIGQRTSGLAYVPFAQCYDPYIAVVARTSRNPAQAVLMLESIARRLRPESASSRREPAARSAASRT